MFESIFEQMFPEQSAFFEKKYGRKPKDDMERAQAAREYNMKRHFSEFGVNPDEKTMKDMADGVVYHTNNS